MKRCTYRARFGCKFRVMVIPDVEDSTLDDHDSLWTVFFDGDGHVHSDDAENFAKGLPQKIRDHAMRSIQVHPNIKPGVLGQQVCNIYSMRITSNL